MSSCCPVRDNVKRIRIAGDLVGIAGLDSILQRALDAKGLDERGVRSLLLSEVQRTNYVPPSMSEAYEDALWKEFKRSERGGPHDRTEILRIEVFGTGCPRCDSLRSEVEKTASMLGIEADILKVTDIAAIAERGVPGLPALAIGGEVVVAGRVPDQAEIIRLLSETKERD